jgi:hypothetical protein
MAKRNIGTPKQRKLTRLIVENIGKDKPEPMGAIIKQAGYSDSMAKNPKEVLKGKAINDILNDNNLSLDRVCNAWNEIIDAPLNQRELTEGIKARDKVAALAQITKIHLAGEKRKVRTQYNFIGKFINIKDKPQLQEIMEDNLKDNKDNKELEIEE